jgi:hypothetical protein
LRSVLNDMVLGLPGSTNPSRTPEVSSPSTPRTVGTQGGTAVGGQLTTQTQTLVLTAGQVVTLGVSGTALTTFTAPSALTTTRIATMIDQVGSGGFGGDGTTGNGAMALRISSSVIGVMLGAVLIM